MFPGGEGKRILEELGDRGAAKRGRGKPTWNECRLVTRFRPRREELQVQQGGAFIAAEGIRLRGPVHIPEGGGIAGRAVLGSLVILPCDPERPQPFRGAHGA